MPDKKTLLGETPLINSNAEVNGSYIMIDDEQYFKIANHDQIRPFFISMVSHTDHWFFIASNGGLSTGRESADLALFPYYTDDKIINNAENTGSKTILRVEQNQKTYLWEPFSNKYEGIYHIQRNIYKNTTGNKVILEELNEDLSLIFRYKWQVSERFGFVKTAQLENIGHNQTAVDLLDGIQNILPYGIGASLQNNTSNLANAYKRNELVNMVKMGIYSLSAMIIDRAEPSEALKASTVWSNGLKISNVLLTSLQLDNFRKGKKLKKETDMRAEPGAYFIQSKITLNSKTHKHWHIVADVNQDHKDVYGLIDHLKKTPQTIEQSLLDDIQDGTEVLKKLVGTADGLQLTGDQLSVGRHFSNVLFNIMRGGVFEDQYMVEKNDLIEYYNTINKGLANKYSDFLTQFEEKITLQNLLNRTLKTKDPDLIRITYEYLPLTFSRRHGDPSRPWNKFTIPGKNEDGTYIKSYEGNWRDIFQNWEALGYAFPAYLPSMITRFVNASTIDGYNPYRITRNGIDWEVIDPDDSWSFIGYWGDHQIIYLLKLLELANQFEAGTIHKMLTEPWFVYANVPYRIKGYDEIVKDPKNTIEFETEKEKFILNRTQQIGTDGKLVYDQSGSITKANLTEKLLVPLLTKLSNFIPEAGIWLNTQRPEWNDANNALVGNGVSVVTLYYMRRYITFCMELFNNSETNKFPINEPVVSFLKEIHATFEKHQSKLDKKFNDKTRKKLVDELGRIGEHYREKGYTGFDGKTENLDSTQIKVFLNIALQYIDHTIHANKRKDGLYHAYNLVEFDSEKASIQRLYEMLEGQVAVLSSGLLSSQGALNVLNALKNSKMYRPDQYSYMLYPDRDLPRFLSKNLIPSKFIENSKLAKKLLKAGDQSIIQKDINDNFHFNGSFHNANDLKAAFGELKHTELAELAGAELQDYLDIFEQLFNHKAFTGRSGTFFGYEGLGSIYWHMVSKLLLAVQENIVWAKEQKASESTIGALIDHYYEIRAGIGINKSPELYGGFPTDPYSHTPGNKGAQQPGMTGQVKEDIISRWAELGIKIEKGQLLFDPTFLNPVEFLKNSTKFEYFDLESKKQQIKLNEHMLAFTFCQTPIIYNKANSEEIQIHYYNGQKHVEKGKKLSLNDSQSIFQRDGKITRVIVNQKF